MPFSGVTDSFRDDGASKEGRDCQSIWIWAKGGTGAESWLCCFVEFEASGKGSPDGLARKLEGRSIMPSSPSYGSGHTEGLVVRLMQRKTLGISRAVRTANGDDVASEYANRSW